MSEISRRPSKPWWAITTTSASGAPSSSAPTPPRRGGSRCRIRSARAARSRVALGDARDRAGATLRREAGPLGIDQHAVAGSEAVGERPHPLELLRLARSAAHEVVRQPSPGDVEAGIGEQLALEHVAQADPVRAGDEVRRQQVVDDARVADQHDHGPRRDLVATRDLEPQPEQRTHRAEQRAGPQLLDAPGHLAQPGAAPTAEARDPQRRQRGDARRPRRRGTPRGTGRAARPSAARRTPPGAPRRSPRPTTSSTGSSTVTSTRPSTSGGIVRSRRRTVSARVSSTPPRSTSPFSAIPAGDRYVSVR